MPQLSTPNDSSLMVSVCVMSYNLEHYISETLDSILMQKVDFKYNIVVSDDCSTDKTREILQQYAAKYPDRITLLLQENNLGVVANFVETLKACRGKYIATLDGDDYWTDPLKLQKQVDFLESNKDFSIVFHNAEIHDETTSDIKIKLFNPKEKSREYTYDEIVKTWSVPTCSVLAINNEQYRYIENNLWFPVQDLPFYLSSSSIGKIYYMSDVMGVYRRLLSSDMNTKEFQSAENMLSFGKYYKELYKDFSEILSKKTINHKSALSYFWAARIFRKNGHIKDYKKYLSLAMEKDSEVVFKQVIQPQNREIKSLKDKVRLQEKAIHDLQEELKRTKNSLHTISSKIHQLINTSGKTEPIKKYKAYKKMLTTYNKIKGHK